MQKTIDYVHGALQNDNIKLYSMIASSAVGAALVYSLINSGRKPRRATPPPRINPDGSRFSPFAIGDEMMVKSFDDVTTLWEAFLRGHRVSKDQNFLGLIDVDARRYNWLTYNDIYKQILNFGAGLQEITRAKQLSGSLFVGAWMSNRVEFCVAEFAAFANSNVLVPLYDTLGSEAVFHIINQTEMQVIICDKASRIDGLFETQEKLMNVKVIVLTASAGNLKDSTRGAAQSLGVQVISFDEVLAIGTRNPRPPQPAKPEDLALISYTSGTTGLPKGVMLTHANCISSSSAWIYHITKVGVPWTASGVHYSYLPMAHLYEQSMLFATVTYGSSIGLTRGDPRKLFEDVAILKPTVFAAVPRVLSRVYDMQNKYFANSSTIAQWTYTLALRYKMHLLKKGVVTFNTWADKIALYPVRQLFGDNLSILVSGGAPIARDVLIWYRCVLGVPVFEGYGQTETTAAATCADPFEMDAGNVGVPFPCNIVKVVDVPDMNYYARDGKGEVCIKGLNCTRGYYREPEKTKELIDEDGWIHTGDIGVWQADGNLRLIDRKKHIFKLAQGEYVAPEKIEGVYEYSGLVTQIFVDGCSLETCTIGIVVPDRDELIELWQNKIKGSGSTTSHDGDKNKLFAELCNNRAVRIAVLKEINEVGKSHGLVGFELVKNIFLTTVPFTLENGFLTPTLKIKRPEVRKHYQDRINALYDEIRHVGELK